MRKIRGVKALNNRSGMALVLALMAVSFLVAITVQLFATVNWQVQAATNFSDSVSMDAMNRSALNLARASLLADQKQNKYDSALDNWNNLGENALHELLGADSLDIKVTDLSGKLQVNALVSNDKNQKTREEQERLQYELWYRFLNSGRFAFEDEQQTIVFLDSLRDWIDNDGQERDHGAEDGYYLALENPYTPRNGPVQSLDELLLIRGMTKDIFYGNEEYSGITEFLTVYGTDGQININTAPALVLQCLADNLDQDMIQGLIEFRGDKENENSLANPEWYRQVRTFPGYIELSKNVITVRSSYFLVASTVRKNTFSRSASSVIYRDEKGIQQLLRWDID